MVTIKNNSTYIENIMHEKDKRIVLFAMPWLYSASICTGKF